MFEIVQATEKQICYVAANLRDSDIKEIWASHRRWPIEIPRICADVECYAATHDGVPFVLFGCNREGAVGVPWLLATESIHTHSTWFLRQSRRICSDWLKRYGILTNFVHAENEECILWLKWLKYEFPEEVFFHGEKFYRFEKRCEVNV